jgi:tetratricopeptide (TPR) repeat protein
MALTDISKHAESVEGFINDLAEAFRKRRWVKILSLIGIAFALLLNPASVEYGLKLLSFRKPDWYSYLVWGIVAASFFVSAFLIALRSKKEEKTAPLPSISIIKGLYPYTNTKEDADWFARLQRGNILQDCLRLCSGEDPFAILSGDSGTGKTSFLQAGFFPNLERQGLRPIYVKLTDSPPLDSIRQALNRDSETPISDDHHSLLECLRKATQVDARPIVLILDQFEQFFTHNKSKASRKLFIQQMAEWYKQSRSLPVKILISIRGDFENRLNEFRGEMKYALPPQNNLSLEKFEPQEAAQVISVIAGEAKIELDASFVEELTKYELADDEGNVSPIDIQILSWMVDGQKSSEERAFNRKAFQKLGGVEGLLERFLNRVLGARGTDARRQAAIKVMLALTDQNVRAGALSLKVLKEKLHGVIPASDIEEAVSWLARGDVRLVTPMQLKNVTLYEMAHERIIPPLRRLAFKEITDVEKAQQTLDRRVNEWIGNNRAHRYLLNFKEWRAINRYWLLITLGTQKKQKEEFVLRSKRRFVTIGLSFAAISIVGLGGYAGYKRYEQWYEEKPETQIHYTQKRWAELIDRNKDADVMKYGVLLLPILDGESDKEMSQALWRQIGKLDPYDRATVLAALAKTYDNLPKSKEAVSNLNNLRQAADETLKLIENVDETNSSYSLDASIAWADLAFIYSTLPNTDEELNNLNKILKAAPNTVSPGPITGILAELIKAYKKLSRTDEAVKGVLEVLRVAGNSKQINESELVISISEVLSTLPETKEKANAINQIQQRLDEKSSAAVRIKPDDRSYILQSWELQDFVTAYSLLPQTERVKDRLIQCRQAINAHLETIILKKDDEQLTAFLDSLNKDNLSNPDETLNIIDKTFQVLVDLKFDENRYGWLMLAGSYSRLSKPEVVIDRLQKILQLLPNDSHEKVRILTLLGETYKKLAKSESERGLKEVQRALDEILQETKHLKPHEQAVVLGALSNAYSSLPPDTEMEKRLDDILSATINLEPTDQLNMWLLLAEKYYKLSKPFKAEKLLAQVQQTSNGAKSLKDRSRILSRVASLYAKLHEWVKAFGVAKLIGNDAIEISALSKILIVWKDARNGTKNIETLEEKFESFEGLPVV